jgi:hypothetical protein
MYTSCRERKNHLKLVTPVSLCVCSVRCPCDRFAVQLCAVARECLQFGAWLTELTSEVQVDAMSHEGSIYDARGVDDRNRL